MSLIGRAHLAAVPDSAEPVATGGLDRGTEPERHAVLDRDDDMADLRAQRDAALGALAAWSARAWAAPAGGFRRSADRRAAEDDQAAHWWGRITTGHEVDDEVDEWRLISVRQLRGGS